MVIFLLYSDRKIRGLVGFYFRLRLASNVLSFRKMLLKTFILLMLLIGLLSIVLLLHLSFL